MKTTKDDELGLGIKLISSLFLAYSLIAIISLIYLVILKHDRLKLELFLLSKGFLLLDIKLLFLSSLVLLISVTLILFKKKIGIYFFGFLIAMHIATDILLDENISETMLSLILPTIMILLLYKHKNAFIY
ncbi:hypothetical protein [Clostridium chrysemydis]|uniref:hypothetical protein n=1 Tax=Clostridium chrysemydis TaxID=2665504 RepID=UPI003F3B56EF